MAFDGQTDSNLPSNHDYLIFNGRKSSESLNGVLRSDEGRNLVKPVELVVFLLQKSMSEIGITLKFQYGEGPRDCRVL